MITAAQQVPVDPVDTKNGPPGQIVRSGSAARSGVLRRTSGGTRTPAGPTGGCQALTTREVVAELALVFAVAAWVTVIE